MKGKIYDFPSWGSVSNYMKKDRPSSDLNNEWLELLRGWGVSGEKGTYRTNWREVLCMNRSLILLVAIFVFICLHHHERLQGNLASAAEVQASLDPMERSKVETGKSTPVRAKNRGWDERVITENELETIAKMDPTSVRVLREESWQG